MNEYLSGKCAHCGRKKEEHYWGGHLDNYLEEKRTGGEYCKVPPNVGGQRFLDSGEKLLHDRAPELLQAAREVVNAENFSTTSPPLLKAISRLESIIGDILRPRP